MRSLRTCISDTSVSYPLCMCFTSSKGIKKKEAQVRTKKTSMQLFWSVCEYGRPRTSGIKWRGSQFHTIHEVICCTSDIHSAVLLPYLSLQWQKPWLMGCIIQFVHLQRLLGNSVIICSIQGNKGTRASDAKMTLLIQCYLNVHFHRSVHPLLSAHAASKNSLLAKSHVPPD